MLNTIAPARTNSNGIVKYPSRSEYYSAIRNPGFAFRKKDPRTQVERDLESGLAMGRAIERVRPNGMRETWSASGGFAIAFKYETPSPKKLWAVRCFYRSSFEANRHYRRVASNLGREPSCRPYFVGCEFFEEGIRVLGNYYPVVKMEWVDGENLKKFLKKNLGRRSVLEQLANKWEALSEDLQKGGIAHGDLQHGNVLVTSNFGGLGLKLIDYDSLYFSKEGASIDDCVKGLPDYQHPLRESLEKQCLAVDYFPQLAIYVSILALLHQPQLWDTYKLDDREGLLFSKTDFLHPTRASIFQTLSQLPQPLPALARSIQNICYCREFEQIPPLNLVLSVVESTGSAFELKARLKPTAAPKQQQRSDGRRRGSLFSWLTGRRDRQHEAPSAKDSPSPVTGAPPSEKLEAPNKLEIEEVPVASPPPAPIPPAPIPPKPVPPKAPVAREDRAAPPKTTDPQPVWDPPSLQKGHASATPSASSPRSFERSPPTTQPEAVRSCYRTRGDGR